MVELAAQCVAMDFENLGGSTLVAFADRQHLAEELALELLVGLLQPNSSPHHIADEVL